LDKFQIFYQQTRTRFFNYLLRMTADIDLAGEIFQESYARYWEHYGRREPSVGLLFTIGRNALVDHHRTRKHAMCYEDRCEDDQPDQETALIGKESYQQVQAAMSALPSLDREVLALAVDGGFAYEEIARLTDLSMANVKVKIHRARQKLRRLLKDE
jgi:RNA polymerase sigma-70 factor (ECF subfamily)